MLKLKHLRHPLRAIRGAQTLLSAHWNMKILGPRGERRFGKDPRYTLQNVTAGFAPRKIASDDDTAILERICSAYIRATQRESHSRAVYRPTSWWQSVRQASLAPAERALASGNIAALRAMYQNFFRDSCSGGLVGVPYKMTKDYSGAAAEDSYLRYFLSDALHRIDYWRELSSNRFELEDLAGPEIGNPFGVMIDGTLVRTGTEYQHYCAHRICARLSSPGASVMEIGGGFGGMAYYLLRDRPATTYIDCDVPESIALASYYLLLAFPQLKFSLFGEAEQGMSQGPAPGVVLLPAFELSKIPAKSVDLTFSSHTMSSLSRDAAMEYLKQIVRITRYAFLHIGRGPENTRLQKLIRDEFSSLKLVEKLRLEWNSQKFRNAQEEECLYEIAGG